MVVRIALIFPRGNTPYLHVVENNAAQGLTLERRYLAYPTLVVVHTH